MISRIIKVEERVIRRSQRLRLITLTETLIILDITKTNLIIVLLYIERKKSCFWFFTNGKQHKERELDMITLRNHAPRSYMTWLLATLSVLDILYDLQRHRRWFRKFTVRFRPIRKEIVSSMYNYYYYCHYYFQFDLKPTRKEELLVFSVTPFKIKINR